MRNRLYIVLLVLTVLFSGCRPKGILHSRELRAVLVDLHKTDAMLQVAGLQYGHEEARQIYYAQVLEKHGITQAQFDSTLVWYTAHPQLFDKIYPKVLADLEAEETQFIAQHESALHLTPTLKPTELSLTASRQAAFSRAQLDSTLWTAQHGYSHSWHERPLVQDSINQFFPQIGVLR